jgi:hypothetical protein
MKITCLNGKTLDTDSYSDINALAIEEGARLSELFCPLKIPFTYAYLTHDGHMGGAINMLHPTKSLKSVNNALVLHWAAERIEQVAPSFRVVLIPKDEVPFGAWAPTSYQPFLPDEPS